VEFAPVTAGTFGPGAVLVELPMRLARHPAKGGGAVLVRPKFTLVSEVEREASEFLQALKRVLSEWGDAELDWLAANCLLAETVKGNFAVDPEGAGFVVVGPVGQDVKQ
jgi:hypothetical protein